MTTFVTSHLQHEGEGQENARDRRFAYTSGGALMTVFDAPAAPAPARRDIVYASGTAVAEMERASGTVENGMRLIVKAFSRLLFAIVATAMMCYCNLLHSHEDIHSALTSIVKSMPDKHGITDRSYYRNALRVAMVIDVNYKESYFPQKILPFIKQIPDYTSISHVLCMIVIEKYEHSGTLYYDFIREGEDISQAAQNILAPDKRGYRIDLGKADKSKWLSKETYRIQLSYPLGMMINEMYGRGAIALTGTCNEISMLRFGLAPWDSPSDKCGTTPDVIAQELYEYAVDDFIARSKDAMRKPNPKKTVALKKTNQPSCLQSKCQHQ